MTRPRPASISFEWCAVNKLRSAHQAARRYSWMRPPRRSRPRGGRCLLSNGLRGRSRAARGLGPRQCCSEALRSFAPCDIPNLQADSQGTVADEGTVWLGQPVKTRDVDFGVGVWLKKFGSCCPLVLVEESPSRSRGMRTMRRRHPPGPALYSRRPALRRSRLRPAWATSMAYE